MQKIIPFLWFNTNAEEAVNHYRSIFKFGLSWQIVPTALSEMLRDPDVEKSAQVMQAMMKMHKIDIGLLQQAHGG